MDIVLVEPENPGNIGAVARVMKNFGFRQLILINPKCDPLSPDARNRAKHANDILAGIKIAKSIRQCRYDYKIGTTGKLGTDYNILRSPLTPGELAEKIASINSKSTAVFFGRESSGLTNEEIEKMDFIVHIPSDDRYPVLNISHAVCVIAYELFMAANKDKTKDRFTPIKEKDKEVMLKMIFSILDNMHFLGGERGKLQKETQKKVWKHVLGKAMLTRREAFALMGFFKKLL